MKLSNYLLLWLLFLSYATCAAGTRPAPPGTVPGQAQLAKQLAAEACQELTVLQRQTPFTDLTPVQAQETFEQVLLATIEKRQDRQAQVAQRSGVAGAATSLNEQLSTIVAFQLVKTCAAAAALYRQFSHSPAAAATLTKAEDEFMQSWSNELCQRLAALRKKNQFQGKTSAERFELFHQEYNASMTQRGPQIMALYGPAGNNTAVVETMARRIPEYMQQHCPQTLLLLKGEK